MSDQSDPNATERQRIEFAVDQSISDEEWDAFNDWRRLRDEAAPSVQRLDVREALAAIMEIIDRDEETWVVEEYQAVIDAARAALEK
jgi:hypothetical protein